VVDCGVPEASCSEWHADGTAGEDDRTPHLVVVAPARPMVRPVQGDTSLVGKPPQAARQRKGHMRGHLQVRKLGLLTTTRLRRGPDIP
jgi:hypothetical protein